MIKRIDKMNKSEKQALRTEFKHLTETLKLNNISFNRKSTTRTQDTVYFWVGSYNQRPSSQKLNKLGQSFSIWARYQQLSHRSQACICQELVEGFKQATTQAKLGQLFPRAIALKELGQLQAIPSTNAAAGRVML